MTADRTAMRAPFATTAFVVAMLAVTPLLVTGSASAEPKPAAKPQPASNENLPVDLIVKGAQLFDDQQYEESIQTLSAALLRPTNTKAQKIEIYRLLALNYITLGRSAEADNAVRGLLAVEPSYELPGTESPRFRDFFRDARARWEAEGRPGLDKGKPTGAAVSIRHEPPASAVRGQPIDVRATFVDPDHRVASAVVFVRGKQSDFQRLDAKLDGHRAEARIPASLVEGNAVEYYVALHDSAGHPLASYADASDPVRLSLAEPKKGWVLPVVIGAGVIVVAAVVGGLALSGAFDGSKSAEPPRSSVTVQVGDAAIRF